MAEALAKMQAKTRAKAWALTAALLLALAAAAPAGAQAQPPRAEAEARAAVERLAAAYVAKDMDALMNGATPELLAVVQGPLGVQRRVGREAVRRAYGPDLAAAQSPSLRFTSLDIAARGDQAEVTAELLAGAQLGQRRLNIPARLAARLVKREGRWLLTSVTVQYPVALGGLEGILSLEQ